MKFKRSRVAFLLIFLSDLSFANHFEQNNYLSLLPTDILNITLKSFSSADLISNQSLGISVDSIILEEKDVIEAVFSPVDDRVVTVSRTGGMKTWDAKTGQLRASFGTYGLDLNPIFSRNGDRLMTLNPEVPQVTVFDSKKNSATLVSGNLGAFSPHDDRIVVIEDGWANVIEKPNTRFKVKGQRAEFSSDGVYFAAKTGNMIQVFDATTYEKKFTLRGNPRIRDELSPSLFSPNGQYILALEYDGTFHTWNLDEKGRHRYLIPEHREHRLQYQFSTHGKVIQSYFVEPLSLGQNDEKQYHSYVYVSEIRTELDEDGDAYFHNKRLLLRENNIQVTSGSFSTDGSLILTTHKHLETNESFIRIWNTKTLQLLGTIQGDYSPSSKGQFSFSYDKSRFAAIRNGRAELIHLSSPMFIRPSTQPGRKTSAQDETVTCTSCSVM